MLFLPGTAGCGVKHNAGRHVAMLEPFDDIHSKSVKLPLRHFRFVLESVFAFFVQVAQLSVQGSRATAEVNPPKLVKSHPNRGQSKPQHYRPP
jgi:hypothetical protein